MYGHITPQYIVVIKAKRKIYSPVTAEVNNSHNSLRKRLLRQKTIAHAVKPELI